VLVCTNAILVCKTIELKEKEWNFGLIKASVTIRINLQGFIFSVFKRQAEYL
jgi:hypothetical protein